MVKSGDLTEQQKWAIVAHYNANLFPGEVKLRRGVLKTMSEELGINTKTISRVALQYKEEVNEKGILNVSLAPQKKGRCGRKMALNNRLKKRIHRKNTITKGRHPVRMLALHLGMS